MAVPEVYWQRMLYEGENITQFRATAFDLVLNSKQHYWQNCLVFLVGLSLTFSSFLGLALGTKFKFARLMTYTSHLGIMFPMFLLASLTWLNCPSSIFFVIALIVALVMSLAGGLLQLLAIELCSYLPPGYPTGLMNGMALSGIIAAIVNIITVCACPSAESATFAMFLVGGTIPII